MLLAEGSCTPPQAAAREQRHPRDGNLAMSQPESALSPRSVAMSRRAMVPSVPAAIVSRSRSKPSMHLFIDGWGA